MNDKNQNKSSNPNIGNTKKSVKDSNLNIKKKSNQDLVVEDLKVKLKDLEDKLLRSLAENDNLRKRHEKEINENFKYAVKNFAESLLTVTDNFQRAINSIPKIESDKNPIVKNLIVGIQAVEKELEDALEKNGVKSFKSIDKKFNPEFHHAVSKIHSQHPEGTIVEELQRGFMIDERLLRPAMVAVSMGPEKKNSPEK